MESAGHSRLHNLVFLRMLKSSGRILPSQQYSRQHDKSPLTYVRYAGLGIAALFRGWSQLLVAAITGQHVIRQAAHLAHTETSLTCFWALREQDKIKCKLLNGYRDRRVIYLTHSTPISVVPLCSTGLEVAALLAEGPIQGRALIRRHDSQSFIWLH